ncbi:MAG: LysE family translocator, partial [Pseudomonadota bacterium]
LFVALERPLLPQFSILIGTFVGLAALNSLAYAPLADPLKTHPDGLTGSLGVISQSCLDNTRRATH